MANSMLCSKCSKWVHGRCSQVKSVSSTLAIDVLRQQNELWNEINYYYFMTRWVKSVCYLWNKYSESSGSEEVVSARARIDGIMFREYVRSCFMKESFR